MEKIDKLYLDDSIEYKFDDLVFEINNLKEIIILKNKTDKKLLKEWYEIMWSWGYWNFIDSLKDIIFVSWKFKENLINNFLLVSWLNEFFSKKISKLLFFWKFWEKQTYSYLKKYFWLYILKSAIKYNWWEIFNKWNKYYKLDNSLITIFKKIWFKFNNNFNDNFKYYTLKICNDGNICIFSKNNEIASIDVDNIENNINEIIWYMIENKKTQQYL